MYNKNPYQAYQKTQVMTSRPDKILLLLYEGAIRFTKMAALKIREKNIPEKGKYISKALGILSELMNTLDHEKGGHLASDLENLYMFMMDKLIDANIKNSAEECEAVERLLTTLYGAWKDVIENPRADGVPSRTLQPELYNQWELSQKGGAVPPTAEVPPGKTAPVPPPRKAS
jgi:flagellar protein FliS